MLEIMEALYVMARLNVHPHRIFPGICTDACTIVKNSAYCLQKKISAFPKNFCYLTFHIIICNFRNKQLDFHLEHYIWYRLNIHPHRIFTGICTVYRYQNPKFYGMFVSLLKISNEKISIDLHLLDPEIMYCKKICIRTFFFFFKFILCIHN